MAETGGLGKYVFHHRHKILYLGRTSDDHADSLFAMQHRRAFYGKIGNEFSDAVFHHPDNSSERQEKIDRMPELQGAVSDGMRIIILAFIILFSSCFQNQKLPQLIVEDPRRDATFTKFVNPITDKYELPKLRETALSNNDLEIRVWLATDDFDGFILKRLYGNWSAIAVKEINCKRFSYFPKDKTYELGKIYLPTPKSGWENNWQKLVEAGILDLPSSDYVSIDGMGYIVETNQNGKYRIYFYSNPDLQKTEEAKRMMKIGEIIADEFGLHNFKFGSLCLEK